MTNEQRAAFFSDRTNEEVEAILNGKQEVPTKMKGHITKEQALALKDGDVVYIVDNSPYEAGPECDCEDLRSEPILVYGLQRIVIGSINSYYRERTSINPETGDLNSPYYPIDQMFLVGEDALAAYLNECNKLQERVDQVTRDIHRSRAEATQLIEEHRTPSAINA